MKLPATNIAYCLLIISSSIFSRRLGSGEWIPLGEWYIFAILLLFCMIISASTALIFLFTITLLIYARHTRRTLHKHKPQLGRYFLNLPLYPIISISLSECVSLRQIISVHLCFAYLIQQNVTQTSRYQHLCRKKNLRHNYLCLLIFLLVFWYNGHATSKILRFTSKTTPHLFIMFRNHKFTRTAQNVSKAVEML